jgi:hypothetical protein
MSQLISKPRLEQLERKERAHDAYIDAIKASKERILRLKAGPPPATIYGQGYRNGYGQALIDLGDDILDATKRAEDARPMP